MSSNIYQHRTLVPAAAPVAPAGAAVSAARLNDLLEFVKHEFDLVSGDAQQFKGQRDEFEHRIGQQVSEVQMMQQHIMDLESRHSSMAQQYEEEIKRLRALLDSRGGPIDHPGSPRLQQQQQQQQQQQGPAPPQIASSGAGGTKSGLPPFNGPGASDGYSNGGPYDRERDGPPGARSGPRGDAGPKRLRMGESGPGSQTGYGGGPPSPGRGPGDAAGPPPPGPIKNERDAGAAGGAGARRGPGYQGRDAEQSPGPGSGSAAGDHNALTTWSDVRLDDVPKDLKKEGSDWHAVFNPNVKRTLDVNLVHTLMHESVVCCVRFSPDGKYLATGCNQSAQIYDTKTGAKVCILMDAAAANKGDLYIRSVCFSPDSKYLATGAEDRQVRVWDIAKKRVKNVFSGHKQEIYSVDWSRDGRIIASGSGDKTVRIWDVESGSLLHTLYTSPGLEAGPSEAGVTSVSISSDNRLVAAGALDTFVRVWDTKTGQQLERLKSHQDSIYSVSFTPDGRNLVSGSLDMTLKMWDLSATHRALDQKLPEEERAGKAVCYATFAGHKDYVLSVSCSPDSQWIASGSKDKGIQFWDPRTGQTQLILVGHRNSVIAISLSPAGGLLASGSGDCNARIWSYDRVAA
ncbi:unnamed protein product [Parajaminaea phylloscopi]